MKPSAARKPAGFEIVLAGFVLLFAAGCASRTTRRAAVPAPSTPSAWNTPGSATQQIEVQGWAKPKTGWLYVLDPYPVQGGASGRVWLVDPGAAKAMGSIATGADPDFALTPDGSHLYVASRGDNQQSNLAEIDTGAGTILETATIDGRVVANGILPYSSMAVSQDGATLRVLTFDPNAPLHDSYLAGYDTATGDLLPARVNLGACGYGRFIDYPTSTTLDYFCPRTNRFRHVTTDAQSRDLDNEYVVPPWVRRLGVAQAFLDPGGRELTIVRGDSAIYTMDLANASFSPTRIPGDLQGRIPPAAWPASPDGSRIYVGYSEDPNTRFYLDFDRDFQSAPRTQTVNQIRVFQTSTWKRVGTIDTAAPIWTAVSAADGRTLYATAPASHSLLVLDATSLHQTRSIPVGGTPSLMLVSP